MTSASSTARGAAAEVVRLEFGFDTEAWAGWLRDRINPDWRLDEWNPSTLLFTGDYRNEPTGLWKCDVVACPNVGHCKGLCHSCVKLLKATGQDPQEFIRTVVPQRKALPGGTLTACIVTRDGVRCVRPGIGMGICAHHYYRWTKYRNYKVPRGISPPLSFEAWLATVALPYTDGFPNCLVVGCESGAQNDNALCPYHYPGWRSALSGSEGDPSAEQWAQRQTPYLGASRFSMIALTPVVQAELLYCLQQRDAAGHKLYPRVLRKLTGFLVGAATMRDQQAHLAERFRRDANGEAFLRSAFWHYGLALDEFHGVTPRDKDQLDLVAIGLKGVNGRTKRRKQYGVADLTVISQSWLRSLFREWAVAERPDSSTFNRHLRAVTIASHALGTRPGGGHDMRALNFIDVNAVVEGIRCAGQGSDKLYKAKFRQNLMTLFFDLLEFGRIADLLDELPGTFARHSSHVIRDEEPNEDEVGSAIPEYVISQLDAQLDGIGAGMVYGSMTPEQIHAMSRTLYVIFRDTGRRPIEVASLVLDCLETIDGEISLLWDNGKGKRLRRRLPITTGTAQAIGQWQILRAGLAVPSRSAQYLFPAISDAAGFPHMESGFSSTVIRAWVDALAHLWSDAPGPDGHRQPFDRTRIYPYAFRHSYAQRHADAGTPVDVLRQLMDHTMANTTMGYYQVSLKRKRAAVKTLAAHVIDRNGRPAPFGSDLTYQRGSVAVPYGGCVEPSNVKAGGNACPLRFQCAGCGFYRPDPSYLAAIEQHINDLKADRETAEAMDVADFVIGNLADQIRAYGEVAASMRMKLADLPAEERVEIEQAAAIMRKSRATGGRDLLPLTVIRKAPPA